MKNCEYQECGQAFEPRRAWQRFCSNKCRQRAHASDDGSKRLIEAALDWHQAGCDLESTLRLRRVVEEYRAGPDAAADVLLRIHGSR